MSQTERDKLAALLVYWIKHNREHGEEFREWAEKATGFGESEVHDELIDACHKINEANELLLKAAQVGEVGALLGDGR